MIGKTVEEMLLRAAAVIAAGDSECSGARIPCVPKQLDSNDDCQCVRTARIVFDVGFEAGLQEAWKRVNDWIVVGHLDGNGCDAVAQRNGMVLAANLILQPQEGGPGGGAAALDEISAPDTVNR